MGAFKKPKGFLIAKNKKYAYAGVHLIVEFWQAKNLNSEKIIKKALKEATIASGSDLLNLAVHQFEPSGFSAVAMVSESHISLHTWPEIGYAAVDVFTCGQTKPYKAMEVLQKYFKPEKINITEIKRGIGAFEEIMKNFKKGRQ